jgi:S-formylglutathione hydrolase
MLPGWTRIEIAGKPADAFDPGPAAGPFALLWLHDEAGNSPATDPALTAEFRSRRLRCLAPQSPACWWLDRVCPAFDPSLSPEQHILENVLPWLEANWRCGPRGVAAAGIGMGGQGAVRLGFRHPHTFPIVASIAGAFDFHERYGAGTPLDEMYPSGEYARQDTAILQISGHDWPPHVWFACSPTDWRHRGNDRLHEKLAAIGVPHVADLDTVGEPGQFLVPMLDFVTAALERESRRLM